MLDSSRTRMLIGDEAADRLSAASVAVFGVGGVGSAAAEAIARAGVGRITLVDTDIISPSNCNRQIVALSSNIGKEKAVAMQQRILDINPGCDVTAKVEFFDEKSASGFDLSGFNAVVDAIDTVTSKLLLIELCVKAGTYIVSSMGTGNKLRPEMLTLADIKDTKVCPLARVMRQELRKRGVTSLPVVYSEEVPIKPAKEVLRENGKTVPGSFAPVPPAAGMILASAALRHIMEK